MNRLLESLEEHALEIINFKNKKMKFLITEQQKSYQNAKIWYICQEKWENKYMRDKKYRKVRDHCHYTGECRGAVHM